MQTSVPLAPRTTLGVGGGARLFVEVKNANDLQNAVAYAKLHKEPWVVLGGGSNILVPDAGYDGLVIKMAIEGITIEERKDDSVIVKAGAGANLDEFIEYAVNQGWWGLENLSSIPGTIGATPVQNVGAYGVEVADCLVSVDVYDSAQDTFNTLSNTECNFGYRTSIFKTVPSRYIITAVTLKLSLNEKPQCTYADLAKYFDNEKTPTVLSIRHAVQDIRSKKFPNWTEVGTAGSFFKNPIVPESVAQALVEKYPDLPHYNEADEMVKLSLAYILDKVCGLRGYKKGNVGLYEKQALVLVVEKGACASEVIEFANEVTQKVFLKTELQIEQEVTTL